MTDPKHADRDLLPVTAAARLTVPTWRYQGEREAADLAYCARFGVTAAPEPIALQGGAWAYALPESTPA